MEKHLWIVVPPFIEWAQRAEFESLVRGEFLALSPICNFLSHAAACLLSLDVSTLHQLNTGDGLLVCSMEEEMTVSIYPFPF